MTPLYSMTGFGKQILPLAGKKISIEIKSLNSKQADINLRAPSMYRSKEGEIRRVISETLMRGKIDCNINVEVTGIESAPKINLELASGYMDQLRELSEKTGTQGDIIGAVMRLPDVLQSAHNELSDEEWGQLEQTLHNTLASLNEFRSAEGGRLAEDLALRLANIEAAQNQIIPLEEERRQRVEDKLKRSLEQLKAEVDQDRFESELIYYLEKYDITEEKVRLSSHIKYFRELLEEGGMVGKKLGFVSQEIGREINTLGSKANHAGMQKLVVEMKDELEKIKEQALNIL
jgi:uncharacterized protein (TIGR00255 family)